MFISISEDRSTRYHDFEDHYSMWPGGIGFTVEKEFSAEGGAAAMTVATLIGVDDAMEVRAISAVARFFGIEIRQVDGNRVPDDGALVLGAAQPFDSVERGGVGRVILKFCATAASVAEAKEAEVGFHSSDGLPTFLQNKTLLVQESLGAEIPSTLAEMDVAATAGARPIWKVRTSPGLSLLVATPPPALAAGQRLAEIFNGETFLHVLPVWLFFRSLCPAARVQNFPLRACMIVDDPNLHSSTYGHVDYAEIVSLADAQPFHLSVATVPLDGWIASPAAIRLFAENPNALSLLIHGNDHLQFELARRLSKSQQNALVEQALARVEAFETKTRLKVDRVMAPPHGVCSPEMMETLLRCGCDGLTTNRWSLWKNSPPNTLPENYGLLMSDILGGGLPVVPRFRFNSKIAINEIVLAAILGQPIVPYGHHKDFGDNLKVVRSTVGVINSLGAVKWMSMGRILESNFQGQMQSHRYRVDMFSRRISGEMPWDVTRLEIGARGVTGPIQIEWRKGVALVRKTLRTEGEALDLPERTPFRARLLSNRPPPGGTRHFRFRTGAFLRRVVSEARDRLRV